MIIAIFILTCVVFFAIKWWLNIMAKRSKLPHGPFPLPLIGNLHLLRKDIHLEMHNLSAIYGDMFTLWMANIPYIVITDTDLARKVCLTTKFADRLPLYVGRTIYTRGAKDIIMADFSVSLKLHRKLAKSAFLMFGDGMSNLENRIMSSVDALLNTLNKHATCTDSVDVKDHIALACFNVISSIVFGDLMSLDDERYLKIRDAIFLMMHSGVTLSLLNFYPFLRHLPNKELSKMLSVINERDVVLSSALYKAEKTFKEDSITTYIEALLKAKHDYKKVEGNIDEILSRDHIEMNIFDMFLAGVDTTATSLYWALMYLVKWPKCQLLAQEEIDNVMKKDKENTKVRSIHKKQMPYTQAIVFETLRLASTLPFGVFHKARQDTELNSYNIEKGTAVMINIWTIHHKAKNFQDPFEFKPERFLDNDGNLIPTYKIKHFFAFSVGPRECIGKELGKNEMFLFLSNMLNNFNFYSSDRNSNLDLYGVTKVTHAPKQYFVNIEKRDLKHGV